MNNKYSIRLSDEEKETLEAKAMKLGYSSTARFARKLINNGLQDYSIKKAEEHVLYNSGQILNRSATVKKCCIFKFLGNKKEQRRLPHG
ncbi:hypothetical protein CC99x_006900 [Candidatus Berkiella cookevillensis]|uniref:Uncharacterized protein n=1 Tax=Candidatus Berkiella cookevillensis TaxID=437022 RepID=A0A0Q9Y8S7_9GAMM|nr:hypothetical protein [Candidatus Berkiella cookevillensis]MCS5708635.1 hypothetical protein [Candidatus Berkiella cookevillensis]